MTDEIRNSGSNADGRDNRGRFVKGNPGKPRGTRHRATQAVERLLNGRAEQLTEKAVELALAGDTTALRICIERLMPPRKDGPVEVDVPPVETAADVVRAGAAVLDAVNRGDLTPNEGRALAALLQGQARLVELHDLEERVAKLEKDKGQ